MAIHGSTWLYKAVHGYTWQYIQYMVIGNRAVFTWLSKEIGFGFGFGFTTPFCWLVYLLWFWFYDSQVKTALHSNTW